MLHILLFAVEIVYISDLGILLISGHLCINRLGCFIFKSVLGLGPSYLWVWMCKNYNEYSLQAHIDIKKLGCCPWHNVQKGLKLSELVMIGEFQFVLKEQ